MKGGHGQRGVAARCSGCGFVSALRRDDHASQIVEFAVTLPLLAIFVVGIFDFGNAFSVKYRVTSAVREGTRLASSQPTLDLTDPNAGQNSVESIATLVGRYLHNAKLDDCGLATFGQQTITQTGPLAWTYTTDPARTGCPGPVTLEVNRGYTFLDPTSSSYPSGMTVEATRLTLSYPYKWQFNKVVQLLVPGGSFTGPTQITAVAVFQNLN